MKHWETVQFQYFAIRLIIVQYSALQSLSVNIIKSWQLKVHLKTDSCNCVNWFMNISLKIEVMSCNMSCLREVFALPSGIAGTTYVLELCI